MANLGRGRLHQVPFPAGDYFWLVAVISLSTSPRGHVTFLPSCPTAFPKADLCPSQLSFPADLNDHFHRPLPFSCLADKGCKTGAEKDPANNQGFLNQLNEVDLTGGEKDTRKRLNCGFNCLEKANGRETPQLKHHFIHSSKQTANLI